MRQHGLTLDTKECKVDTIGKCIATIVGHKPIIPLIQHQLHTQNYKLLVLDIRSNDLDPTRQPKINTSQLVRELVSHAEEIGKKLWIQSSDLCAHTKSRI